MYFYLEKVAAKNHVLKVLKKSETPIPGYEQIFGTGVAMEYQADSLPQHITYDSKTNTIRPATPDEVALRNQLQLFAGLGILEGLWHKGNFNPNDKAEAHHTHPATDIITDTKHQFVADTQINQWDNKANTTGTYPQFTSGKAQNADKVNGITFHKETKSNGVVAVWGQIGDPDHAWMLDAYALRKFLNVEGGATNYIHPPTHPASMIVTTAQMRFVSDAEKQSWNNKSERHDHPYLPLSGGTVTGVTTFKKQVWFEEDVELQSDARVKGDIRDPEITEEQLEKAMKYIDVYRYHYLQNPNRDHLGFLAQEWKEVFGEDCVDENDEGILQLKIMPMMAIMWKAIQKLYREVGKEGDDLDAGKRI